MTAHEKLGLMLLRDQAEDATDAELRGWGRFAALRAGLPDPGARLRLVAVWFCGAAMLAAIAGPTIVYLHGWAHRADSYPVLDPLDLERDYWRSLPWCAGLALALLGAMVLCARVRMPRIAIHRRDACVGLAVDWQAAPADRAVTP